MVEQLLELSRFTDTALELVPRSVRRASAAFALSVVNQGNTTLRVSVRGRDAAGAVRVECASTRLTVFPGGSAHSRIRRRVQGNEGRRPVLITDVAELMREVALEGVRDELPHSLA